jgi:hypothetical protein
VRPSTSTSTPNRYGSGPTSEGQRNCEGPMSTPEGLCVPSPLADVRTQVVTYESSTSTTGGASRVSGRFP